MTRSFQPSPETKKALTYYNEHKGHFLKLLGDLVRIPSISFPGFPAEEVNRCAEAVAGQMKTIGLENIEILKYKDAHPYVYADWLHAPGKPTVLLYAHHDVQPVGDEKLWKSPPFEPTERDGRLYGRGAADDKAGIMVHLAAISSFLQTSGKLPINVKVLIEGEEEVGSANLGGFVSEYKNKLQSDAMILTDTANFDTGIPTLTVSLRGMVSFQIEVRALGHSLHSGLWGGPVPDPAMALSQILGSFCDHEGRVQVPGLWDEVRPVTKEEDVQFKELPFDEAEFRKQASVLDGVSLRPGRDGKISYFKQNWREPSFSINAMEVSSRKNVSNIIPASSWARCSLRIVPDMNPETVMKKIEDHVKKQNKWNLDVKITTESFANPWGASTTGPKEKHAFEAAQAALELGYEKKTVLMGCGATIPFVEPLSLALGGIPALLMGVEDPYTNAHSENESLHLGDFEKAIKSAIYFYSFY